MTPPDKAVRHMRIADERVLHNGHNYHFVELTIRYKDGVTRTKPIVRHNGAATILPILDTNDGPRVVMVRNERITVDDFLLELPAGGIDPGEAPIQAAARELTEETGYHAKTIEPLCRFLTTPGLTDELMHVFVARDLTQVGQNLEPYESLSVELIEPQQLIDLVERNDIIDAKTMLAVRTAHDRGII